MKQKIKEKIKRGSTKKVLLAFVVLFLFLGFLDPVHAGPLKWAADSVAGGFMWVINTVLTSILALVSLILLVAGFVFDWAINPENISNILGKPAIYTGWSIVRDMLNLTFILILLFSAFATIFQIEKYHLRKILLLLVIMALLVNFSFPITMFIIDASNMLMYFFLNAAFPDAGNSVSFSSKLAYFSNIAESLIPKEIGETEMEFTKYILVTIVFTFILAITLLVIAVIFVIRIFVLAILLIFAPIGFVANILPSTASFASRWWDNLFKYAFIGPILTFVLLISLLLMAELMQGDASTGISQRDLMIEDAQNNGKDESTSTALGDIAFLFLPIVLLWVGIMSSIQGSVVGANAVINQATKARNWGGRLPGRAAGGVWRSTGAPGAYNKTKENFKKEGELFGKKIPLMGSRSRENREDRLSARMTGGERGVIENERTKVNEMRKKWKDEGGKEREELEKIMDPSNKKASAVDRKAAALEMAEKTGFGDGDKHFNSAARAIANDKVLRNTFDDKVKEKRIDLFVNEKIRREVEENKKVLTEGDKDKIIKEEVEKMNVDNWAKQNFENADKNNRFKSIAKEVYKEMKDKKQEEIQKKISGKQLADGSKAGIF